MTKDCAPDPTSRRDMVVRELGRQMSMISEQAVCPLWAWHMEDELPAVLYAATLSGSPGHYRGVEISPVYAAWYTPRPDSSGHGGCGPADSPSDAKSGS
jgi:hypothetical protein